MLLGTSATGGIETIMLGSNLNVEFPSFPHAIRPVKRMNILHFQIFPCIGSKCPGFKRWAAVSVKNRAAGHDAKYADWPTHHIPGPVPDRGKVDDTTSGV